MLNDGTDLDDLAFEAAYGLLQEIVERLEQGNLPLEDSLALFERGTQLVRRCAVVLDAAELRVTVLTQELDEQVNAERRRPGGANADFGIRADSGFDR